ncbi:MAG TPA: alpha/beta fold hydrolase [Herpetosiphonaceae bacterium]
MNIHHEWRSVNGIRLHCAVAGSGPLLILLHGFPEFWYSWRHQIPVLAEHFTVVAPDLRGYNESDKPPRIADYSVPVLVEDVIQLIRSFDQERAIIAGHDWGGLVAWATALSRPDLVEKLIALNIPHPRLFVQHVLTNPRQMVRSWYMLFFQLPWLPEATIRANNYRMIDGAFRGMAVHKEQFPAEVIAEYKRAIAKPGALTSALNYYRAMMRGGTLGFTADLDPVARMPVMVVWGEQDTALGKELNDRLRHYVPQLTLHFIPDASHWVQQDRPDLVNGYMLDFLLG